MNGMNWILIFVFLFQPIHIRSDWLTECAGCQCKWNSGKKTADCKNASLTMVPKKLHNEIQVLDLSSNFIPELYPDEFLKANLLNLHKVYIRNCTLQHLHRDSLKGLGIVIELDLSSNLLRTIVRGVFMHLVKLRVLVLNNNRLEQLTDGTFRNLKYLHKIELMDNSIYKIDANAFVNLPVLSQIYFDGNKLSVLQPNIFEHLTKLTSLSLRLNPWNCTCEFKPFRDFTLERNLYTPPTDCYAPPKLRGTLWTELTAELFSCPPLILNTTTSRAITVIAPNDNVTISCQVQSTNSTTVSWALNNQPISNNQHRIINRTIRNLMRTDPTDVMIISDLMIFGVRLVDVGKYTCTATNSGGKQMIDVLLSLNTNDSSDTVLFLSINTTVFILIVFIITVFIIGAILLTCCYCHKKSLPKTETVANGKIHYDGSKINSVTQTALPNGIDSDLHKQQRNQTSHNQQSHQHHIQTEFITNGTRDKHGITMGLGNDEFTGLELNQPTVVLKHESQIVNQIESNLPPDLLPTYGKIGNDKIPEHQAVTLLNGETVSLTGSLNGLMETRSYVKTDAIDDKLNDITKCDQVTGYKDNIGIGNETKHKTIGKQRQLLMMGGVKQQTDLGVVQPKQSIVRTTPSFGFLSSGYQHNNFL